MRPITMDSLARASTFIALLFVPPLAAALETGGAATLAPGTYRCVSYNVSGGGGSCRNMQPLVLNGDGTYRYSSTRGRWSVRNGRLVLSESELWGPGEILGRDTVRFAYDYRGWRHVVTWSCQDCAGDRAPPARAAGGSYVGVSLTLEFDQEIGGVSGFVIVPAEHARSYTHNAPLPPGAVQGLAWERSATAVSLATNKQNPLLSGRRYVVFLSWPRETIPVAVLDLPPTRDDFSATLRATRDGAAVLRRLGSAAAAPQAATPPAFPLPPA
ncbi:MAG: hypothetical protein AB1773_05725 [Pseudomonadota bacterium]